MILRPTTSRFVVRFAASMVLALGMLSIGQLDGTQAQAASNRDDALVIRQVDTRTEGVVNLTVMRLSGNVIDNLSVRHNGETVNNASTNSVIATENVGVCFVVDTSNATEGALSTVRDQLEQFISTRPASEQVAIVSSSSSGARLIAGFTLDSVKLQQAIGSLHTDGYSAIEPGLSTAAQQFSMQNSLQPNIVVVSGSSSITGSEHLVTAFSDVRQSGATLFAVSSPTERSSLPPELITLVKQTGGTAFQTQNNKELSNSLASIQNALNNQQNISYSYAKRSDTLDIAITDGSNQATTQVGVNTLTRGAAINGVKAKRSGQSTDVPLETLRLGLAFFGLLSAGLLIYGIASSLSKNNKHLSDALSFYRDDLDNFDATALSKLADSQLLKKAVESTTKIAQRRGLLEVVEAKLSQADVHLNAGEVIFASAVFTALAAVVGAVFFQVIGLIVTTVIAIMTPLLVLNFLANRRRAKFNSQLPSTLETLASTLRAGYSLPQGFATIARELPQPMSVELQRALTDARLGKNLLDAFEEIAIRMQSLDFRWAVLAMRIQSQVGGNLAELLSQVAETMIERERFRREVRALTAEGKLSGIVLVGLPPIIAGIVLLVNPGYMYPMLSSVGGQIAIGVGVVMNIVGWVMMQKMIDIKA